ncbi:hypothetical protein WBG06_26375 [Nocardioides sp. CCNWLW239]|uniref:hypothetical protein n=1 Tax=Nocardioides sp. CCNWLW239 TaxID=3128902 RepID=UPI0030160214
MNELDSAFAQIGSGELEVSREGVVQLKAVVLSQFCLTDQSLALAPTIVELVSDHHAAAVADLLALVGLMVDPGVEGPAGLRESVRGVLAECLPAVYEMLDSPEANVRRESVHVLSSLGPREVSVSEFRRRLGSELDAEARSDLIFALSSVDSAAGGSAALPYIWDESPGVSVAALVAISKGRQVWASEYTDRLLSLLPLYRKLLNETWTNTPLTDLIGGLLGNGQTDVLIDILRNGLMAGGEGGQEALWSTEEIGDALPSSRSAFVPALLSVSTDVTMSRSVGILLSEWGIR